MRCPAGSQRRCQPRRRELLLGGRRGSATTRSSSPNRRPNRRGEQVPHPPHRHLLCSRPSRSGEQQRTRSADLCVFSMQSCLLNLQPGPSLSPTPTTWEHELWRQHKEFSKLYFCRIVVVS
ncbi:hypothetical protein VPH35_044894 [Triticum aestivum]